MLSVIFILLASNAIINLNADEDQYVMIKESYYDDDNYYQTSAESKEYKGPKEHDIKSIYKEAEKEYVEKSSKESEEYSDGQEAPKCPRQLF